MGKEYTAKVFKSGNSLALRLPKALGLEEGTEMVVREMQHGYSIEPVAQPKQKIDLGGIYGSKPGLKPLGTDDRALAGRALDWQGKRA